MKIGKVRVDYSNVGGAGKSQSSLGLVPGSSVNPHTIEDNLVCAWGTHQIIRASTTFWSSDFQSDKAIVIGYGDRRVHRNDQLCHCPFGRGTAKPRSARKRSHTREAWSDPCSLWWNCARCTNRDPVRVVAALVGKFKPSGVICARGEHQRIPTTGSFN